MQKKILLTEKILIAGARGMAGSAIYRALIKAKYGQSILGGEIYTPNRKELDLSDINQVKKWFETYKPTIVIIAAAKVGGILANKTYPADFILENLKIQTNLIETSWKFGVKRLLFLGSSCIYPKHAQQPIKEESLLEGALEPTNEWYAIAKIAGIKLCQSLRIQYGFDAISLMPTNLYGPGDNYDSKTSHVMASLIRKFCEAARQSSKEVTCWGSGKILREFMHADDLGEAVIFALERWNPEENTNNNSNKKNIIPFINVGTGKDLTIEELAKKIASIVGFKGSIIWDKTKPDGTPKKQLDISRIKKLGWEPKIKLDQGIEMTVSEYLKSYKNNYKSIQRNEKI
tara:strand:+ start:117 stop:1151 length:1035 start_codon:yes stop_codon:yes gene_type:complete